MSGSPYLQEELKHNVYRQKHCCPQLFRSKFPPKEEIPEENSSNTPVSIIIVEVEELKH